MGERHVDLSWNFVSDKEMMTLPAQYEMVAPNATATKATGGVLAAAPWAAGFAAAALAGGIIKTVTDKNEDETS